MDETQTQSPPSGGAANEYTGILKWNPAVPNDDNIAVADILTIVSLFVAEMWTGNQCKDKLAELLDRDLTTEEVTDLLSIANYVKDGGSMAECRLQKVRNGLLAIERNLGLTDAEIRQLAGL